ncbi:hypothetical protein FGO68_gene3942 [Halteria grandinella]|uniref:HMG box domain-containing protein n=1 Tax=Halteria grandinella TaxID=5974 RepID=A0A8J8SZG2_HALGN|nr:hypothetical protein FGO68_gene3942 [Halteria grandinella]
MQFQQQPPLPPGGSSTYPSQASTEALANYMANFLRFNAPRIATFFLDMHNITQEYIQRSQHNMSIEQQTYQALLYQQQTQQQNHQIDKPVVQSSVMLSEAKKQQPERSNMQLPSLSQKSIEKKKKDKNRPENEKKPLTPFFVYMMGMRDKIKEQHPDVKSNEVTKIASELWKNLTTDEKEQWRNVALERAITNGQNTNFDYLQGGAGDKKKRSTLAKVNPKDNPEEHPGYTSSLSD